MGNQKLIAYTVINKKTRMALQLENPYNHKGGSRLLLEDFITSPNTSSPQDSYFILRFEKSRSIYCYGPSGELLFTTMGGHGPVHIDVKYCGRNLIVTQENGMASTHHFYAPIKGGDFNFWSKIRQIYGDTKINISAKEVEGEVRVCVHYKKDDEEVVEYYTVSDGLVLKKIKDQQTVEV